MSTNANEDRKKLNELLTEASELEIDLKKQEQQKQMVETFIDFDDEKEFLRNSLKDIYEDIILIDLKKAIENKIQEKLWRNIFYNHIEELKHKLFKIKHENISEYQAAYHELCRYLDLGTGFYHTLVNVLKIRENIDLDRIGIEIFLNSINTPSNGSRSASKFKRKELTAEFIQQCLIRLGDFARYRVAILESDEKRWEFARHFYNMAAMIYCDNGSSRGAQEQLAILAFYNENDLDTVYWHCFSLATKQPPKIAADNLNLFYSNFGQKIQDNNFNDYTKLYQSYIDPEGTINDFDKSLRKEKNNNTIHLGNTLKKIIFILIFTLWDLRAQNHTVELGNFQSYIIGLGFGFLASVLENLNSDWNNNNMEDDNENGQKNGHGFSIALECMPVVPLWCEYIGTFTDVFGQLFIHSKPNEKGLGSFFFMNVKRFFKSLTDLLNYSKISKILMEKDDFSEISNIVLPEDIEFLGIVPLRNIQQEKNFTFTGKIDHLKVRMARLIIFAKKMAELKSLDIFGYDPTGVFMMIDEEMKRVMKLMAQQLLQDQVTSLEHNLQRMGHSPQKSIVVGSNNPVSSNKEVVKTKNLQKLKQCVIGKDIMLNRLNYVKKWISDKKHVVIVPLDVIDSLDLIKKGNNPENARAREAIRFLDHQLLKQQNQSNNNKEPKNSNNHNNDHFIHIQKIHEKLQQWSCAKEYIKAEDDNKKQNVEDKNIKQTTIENVDFVSEDELLIKYAKKFGISVVEVGNI
ncbi:3000_t:CDS:10 [Entrophospora sp. SA101]|nr:3000_t:CDS:10 [Entrophospora sp. SA101]